MAIDSISQNLDRLAAQGVDTRDLRRLIATSYHSDDVLEVQLSRRLLRTTKTLVLPAQVNMTLITNSYDVVHS
jgi:ribonuclease BN (tRNA processing enzyme)